MDRNSSNVDFPPYGALQKVAARPRNGRILHNLNFCTAAAAATTNATTATVNLKRRERARGTYDLAGVYTGELLFIRIFAREPRRKFFTRHTLRRVNRMFSRFNPEKRINSLFSLRSTSATRIQSRAHAIDRSIDRSVGRLVLCPIRRRKSAPYSLLSLCPSIARNLR